ncbi:hypothetical protein QFC21_002087 [Naganishia friedmannii]|uniref:Uncharacterized protein n=1 Tax=Naganishia friedmannii TaxID=89922 RepID=A0ACC2VYM0_9TREE|nr:hypothetical protein QFC21_002087 [Naganishia friedmannii]
MHTRNLWGRQPRSRFVNILVQEVVHASVRGLKTLQGHPVFAKALSTLGQNSFTQVAAINEPITILNGAGCDIEINPEDIIVADEDGVVAIPLALAEKVIAIMTVAAEQDARSMEDLIAGHGVSETLKKHRN